MTPLCDMVRVGCETAGRQATSGSHLEIKQKSETGTYIYFSFYGPEDSYMKVCDGRFDRRRVSVWRTFACAERSCPTTVSRTLASAQPAAMLAVLNPHEIGMCETYMYVHERERFKDVSCHA